MLPPMKSARGFVVVLVTAPDLQAARRLARTALEDRLVACANLVPRVESHYWWQGKIESSAEVMVVMKTTEKRLAALERAILAAHPYDTPEILALGIRAGQARYLDWLGASVAPQGAGT